MHVIAPCLQWKVRIAPPACLVLVISTLAACGGVDEHADTTTETSSAPATSDLVRTVNLGCAGGLRVKGAEVTGSGNDVSVACSENETTPGETPTEYISYIVTITSGDGQRSGQLAKKMYVSGERPSQFIYDAASVNQTNLTADGGVDPSNIYDAELHFPGALEGIASGWKTEGVVNIDGQDLRPVRRTDS